MQTIKKICIVGPESTGKSTLCQALAKHYNTVFVPEVARTYVQNLNRPYQLADLDIIAQQQLELENKLLSQANNFLFCDTNLLVLKIWSEVKYNTCSLQILNAIAKTNYHYHILPNIDLPWQPDPLREHPNLQEREYLFKMYVDALSNSSVPFSIISGNGNERLGSVVKVLGEWL